MLEHITGSPFIVAAIILFLDMSCVFLVALYLRNNGIVDIGYGLAYIMIAATILYNFGLHPLGGILTILVSIWGLRLAIRIHERNRAKPEDFRYAAWRAQWTWFKTRSYFQIFMLQGAIIYLIALPVIVAASHPAAPLTALTIVGVSIWIFGFFFESVGDYQLDRFIKDPSNKGSLMQSGLWAYTRHPNYFGEATMWWGVWLAALPAIMPLGTLVVIGTFLSSPALITFLLLKVSGVPMLEKAMRDKPGWSAYASKVSMFIPWIPKK